MTPEEQALRTVLAHRQDATPRTAAGKALVEWAQNAHPKQVDIWREHALLIEAEASKATVERIRAAVEALAAAMMEAGDIHGVIDKGEATPEVAAAIFAALPAEPAGAGLRGAWHQPKGCQAHPIDPVETGTGRVRGWYCHTCLLGLAATPVGEAAALDVERLARALVSVTKASWPSEPRESLLEWRLRTAAAIAAAYEVEK